MKTEIKLSQTAIEKLYDDYSRNYIVQSFLLETLEWKLERTLNWFIENWYWDAEKNPAKNEDFINRAKEMYPDYEEEELRKQAELLKTEYTERRTDIKWIRHQIEELTYEIWNSETVLPRLLDMLNSK
jgi:hypothetical protein